MTHKLTHQLRAIAQAQIHQAMRLAYRQRVNFSHVPGCYYARFNRV